MIIRTPVVGELDIFSYAKMLSLGLLPGQNGPIAPFRTLGVLREIARYSGEDHLSYLIEDTVNSIHPLFPTPVVIEDTYLLESALIHGQYRRGEALSLDEIAQRLASPLSSEALELLRT